MTLHPPAPPDPLRRPGDPPPVCNRGPRDPHFAGRDDELEEVSRLLKAQPILITDGEGLPRSGKSAFALEYCHRFGQRYNVIWWFDCRAEGGLRAQQDALKEAAGPVSGPGQWRLTVYDGVRTAGELDGLLSEGSGHVLITFAGEGGVPGARPYPLKSLTCDEPIILLMRKAPALDPAQAARLAKALGHRPATLSEVGDLLLENPDLDVDACLTLIQIGGSVVHPPTPAVPAPRPPAPGESPTAGLVPSELKAQLVDELYQVEELSNGGVDTWIKLIEEQLGPLDIGGATMRARLVHVVNRALRHEDALMLTEMVKNLRVLTANDPALPRVAEIVGELERRRYP